MHAMTGPAPPVVPFDDPRLAPPPDIPPIMESPIPPLPARTPAAVGEAIAVLRDIPRGGCPQHHTRYGTSGWSRGLPRCESCRHPFRIERALASLRALERDYQAGRR
jgi:hypothetical protein